MEAAGGFIQGGVLYQLAYANLEYLFIGIDGGGLIAAGSKAGDHQTGGSSRKKLFAFHGISPYLEWVDFLSICTPAAGRAIRGTFGKTKKPCLSGLLSGKNRGDKGYRGTTLLRASLAGRPLIGQLSLSARCNGRTRRSLLSRGRCSVRGYRKVLHPSYSSLPCSIRQLSADFGAGYFFPVIACHL